jgi:hypothetical protein
VIVTEEPKAYDDAPSVINDHPFVPQDEWWSLCKHCGLAQAAHSSSTINTQEEIKKDHMAAYGEVRYATPMEVLRRERDRVHQAGRARIGYYSDDNPEDE